MGNIHTKSDVGTYQYDEASPRNPLGSPNAVIATPGKQYEYDLNGNMIRRGDLEMEYTSFQKIRRVIDHSTDQMTEWSFDAAGERISKETVDSHKLRYLGDFYVEEEKTTSEVTKTLRVPAQGRYIAEIEFDQQGHGDNVTDERIRHRHTQRLDSVTLLTDENGDVLEERSYDVFGKERSPDWFQNAGSVASLLGHFGFGEYERDTEIGLMNAGGRHYDPELGKFLQPDPLVSRPTFSEDLNRYSFAWNNPLTITDPTGLQESDIHLDYGLEDEAEQDTNDELDSKAESLAEKIRARDSGEDEPSEALEEQQQSTESSPTFDNFQADFNRGQSHAAGDAPSISNASKASVTRQSRFAPLGDAIRRGKDAVSNFFSNLDFAVGLEIQLDGIVGSVGGTAGIDFRYTTNAGFDIYPISPVSAEGFSVGVAAMPTLGIGYGNLGWPGEFESAGFATPAPTPLLGMDTFQTFISPDFANTPGWMGAGGGWSVGFPGAASSTVDYGEGLIQPLINDMSKDAGRYFETVKQRSHDWVPRRALGDF